MYFLFDIGGTNMRLGVSKDGAEVDVFRVLPTPPEFEVGMTEFRNVYSELSKDFKIEKIAGGIAGSLTKAKDALLTSPHLSSWVSQPLRKNISEITGINEVHIENDAALVGLGEATAGSGKGFSIIAYLTISTGIGGARIVQGKIDQSMYGFEPGHQLLDIDQSLLSSTPLEGLSGSKGEFENLASGSGIKSRFGIGPSDITDSGIWDHINWILACGITNTILFWSPDIVILGGGVVESGSVNIEQIKAYMRQTLTIFPEHPEIRKASLKDVGGLYGSLSYLKSLYV